MPLLVSGEQFSTVGISHLTTSRRHLGQPALSATETTGGFVLDGFSPWVTGGAHADTIVTGATLADGRQILAVVPTTLPGIAADEPARLVGLSASATGAVRFDHVEIERDWLLAGPIENVMASGIGGNTGGLQTSTLAVGLARGAIDYLREKHNRARICAIRPRRWHAMPRLTAQDLLSLAAGQASCTQQDLRFGPIAWPCGPRRPR